MMEETKTKPPARVLYHESTGTSMASLMSDISLDTDTFSHPGLMHRNRNVQNPTIYEMEDENDDSSWKGYIDEEGNNRATIENGRSPVGNTNRLQEQSLPPPRDALQKHKGRMSRLDVDFVTASSRRLLSKQMLDEMKLEKTNVSSNDTLVTVESTDASLANVTSSESTVYTRTLEEDLIKLKLQLAQAQAKVDEHRLALAKAEEERDELRADNDKLQELNKELSEENVSYALELAKFKQGQQSVTDNSTISGTQSLKTTTTSVSKTSNATGKERDSAFFSLHQSFTNMLNFNDDKSTNDTNSPHNWFQQPQKKQEEPDSASVQSRQSTKMGSRMYRSEVLQSRQMLEDTNKASLRSVGTFEVPILQNDLKSNDGDGEYEKESFRRLQSVLLSE